MAGKGKTVKRTLVIWDSMDNEIKFFVLDGDQTKYDGVYIQSRVDGSDAKLQKGLAALVYTKKGTHKVSMVDKFPRPLLSSTAVITAGIIP